MPVNNQMKYFIWGAGERGRRILFHIENENIMGFVDSNTQKLGEKQFDKKVIDIDEYIQKYSEYPLIITFVGEQEGINYLKEKGINNYFRLSDCPGEFQEPTPKNILKDYIQSLLNEEKKYAIYGCTIYSLKVYDWIKEYCLQMPYLLIDNSISEEILESLHYYEYQYRFISNESNPGCEEILICTKYCPESLSRLTQKISIREIYDCSNQIEKYYNNKIEIFKNKYFNKRCFIVATGPSLKIEDLEILKEKGEICFSMNHIYKAFGDTKWRPDYYVVSDYNMLTNYAEDVRQIDAGYAFIGDSSEAYWMKDNKDNHIRFHEVYESCDEKQPTFSDDFSRKSYLGYTVTYTCMQLAAYMGFSEIYLLGVDFSYGNKQKYDHFFKEDKLTCTGFGKQVELAYQSAYRYAKANGIKIYNATRGGCLEIFERVNFDDVFLQ